RRVADAAILACLGDRDAHGQMVRALASADERDVEIAQAYVRDRPITDRAELRQVAAGISRIPSPAAQVRAIDTLGLMHIEDREILKELENAFATARSVNVQRAIAEVF